MGKISMAIDRLSRKVEHSGVNTFPICKALEDINDSITATNIYLKKIGDSVDYIKEKGMNIRPCLYFDNDGEHSVAFHSFNRNMAIIELSNGIIKEVPFSNIQLLDSKVVLNDICRIDNVESLKRYWGNEECFKKKYEQLKNENPELFAND